ncbi:amino acid adenylation domain-containing protein [Larsenimonas rhizosphaerae]|uniref:amino acid adenylation domain-containing protein n=1 Tax=Larsenimonas rhizosphaerae TaxID=2944682 RepID=UPI00203368A8|nr:amino acid adenylation domain-containing protein [Larsenimonas rhizosphaerae]MCM2130158.1 amino acid adenylation domain-containing protein [Larsenimonas rhizosphaerae]
MSSSFSCPLSSAQAGIWYAQQMSGSLTTYTTAQCVRLTGHVDVARLRDSICRMISEAPSLTARVELTREGLRQSWVPDHVPCVERVDLQQEIDPAAAAQRWKDAVLARGIDPTTGVLYRFALLEVSAERVDWFMAIHHLAADAYAYSLLQRRACELYCAALSGQPSPEAWFAPVTSMVDEEMVYQDSTAFTVDRAYWTERFSDDPDPVSLTDSTAMAAARSLRREIRLDSAVIDVLTRWSHERRLHPAEAFVAAVGAYVSRFTRLRDITLGFPMMGRMQGASLRVPTTQVNVLPLRLPLGPEHTPTQWAERARGELSGLRRHQRYRHEALQRDLERRPGARSLFGPQVNVMPFSSPDWPDCDASIDHLVAGPEHDISFYLHWDGIAGQAKLAVEANPNRYTTVTLRRHLKRLLAWVDTFCCHPETPLFTLPLLLSEERAELSRWNTTEHPVETTDLATLFERQARLTPESIALVDDAGACDYRMLNEQANQLAHWLTASGVQPGDIVGIAVPRSIYLEVALLATQKLGAAFMPLSSDYPVARLAYMIEQARPSLIISVTSERSLLPDTDVTVIMLDSDEGQETLTRMQLDNPDASVREPTALSYVLFTSGSTGKPKGVMIEHQAIVNRLLWMQATYPLDATDRVLQKTPAGFDVSVWEFFWPLLAGATLVMARPGGHKDPWYLAETIQSRKITTLHFVPSMLQAFLDQAPVADCTTLRRVFCSGEALMTSSQVQLHEALPQVELHNLYGPTEAAIDVSSWQCDRDDQRASLPIGRPIWNTTLHVLDEQRAQVPIGATGELYIGGMNLARGYLYREDLTLARFITHPLGGEGGRLYATGDLARWNDEGAIEYLGRLDGQVKLRGQRIELDEISAALNRVEGVQQSAVTVVTSHGDPVLVGYVVPEPHADLALQSLRGSLALELPSYMVPQHFCILTALPLTDNGKLDRRALPMPTFSGAEHYRAPRTEEERLLCELFAEVLDCEKVGIDDNFFDLGGHSLTAVSLSGLMRERMGRDISIATLFEAPTVAGLCTLSAASEQDGLSVVLTLSNKPTGTPLFLCHPAGGLGWCYTALARSLTTFGPIHALQARGLADASEVLPATMESMARDYMAELKYHQPEGPYYLAGWSVGGMLAHTLACQLQADGEDVHMLAMLDAYPGDQWRHLAPPGEQDALTALLRIAGMPLPEAGVGRNEVIAMLRQEGHALGSLSARVLDAMVDVVINNSRLVRDSTHHVFEGDVLFFTAAAPRDEAWLDRRGWQPYVTGELVNLSLPCDHPGMISDPVSRRIAREMERWKARRGADVELAHT